VFLVALWQTFFELFPVTGLNGWTLFTRSPVVWFVLMVAAAFLTLHLLVNPSATTLEMPENRALLLLVVVLAVYSQRQWGHGCCSMPTDCVAWRRPQAQRSRHNGVTILVWLCVAAPSGAGGIEIPWAQ